jgi:hypothetical protein
LRKKIVSELEPFFDSIRTKPACFEIFKQSYFEFISRSAKALKIMTKAIVDFLQAPYETVLPFLYLGFVESAGNNDIDFLVMLLVANGVNFHIECRYGTPRIKHAYSMKDLEKERVPLTTKLNFLRENGIKTLPSILDSQLRNDIAHFKFEVRPDGIYIRKRRVKDLFKNDFTKLTTAIRITDGCIFQLAKEKGIYSSNEGMKNTS